MFALESEMPGGLDESAFTRLRRIGGEELVRKIVALFLEHAPARAEAATTGWAETDLDRIERAAHSLKTSAWNVGARRLHAICEAAEAQARDGGGAGLEALVRDLADETRAVCQRLHDARGEVA